MHMSICSSATGHLGGAHYLIVGNRMMPLCSLSNLTIHSIIFFYTTNSIFFSHGLSLSARRATIDALLEAFGRCGNAVGARVL